MVTPVDQLALHPLGRFCDHCGFQMPSTLPTDWMDLRPDHDNNSHRNNRNYRGSNLFRRTLESLTIATASSEALAGSTSRFLSFNRFPARVFMGDAGSAPISRNTAD